MHGWLLDAMVAPLLVSALLHSATLVLCSMVLLHGLAYSTSSHAAVLTLLSLQGDWQSLEICVWVASGGSSS